MKPPSVFIIASNADYAPAWRVHQHLSEEGVECFFCDEALLRVGEKGYQSKAERALENAAGLVVVAGSRERVEAEWVRGMWRRFLDKRGGARAVTTVRCDGMTEDEMPRTLRRGGSSLAFPEELAALHGRLLHPGENRAAAGRKRAGAASCTRRFLFGVTALNVVILGAVVWLLWELGGGLLFGRATEEYLTKNGSGIRNRRETEEGLTNLGKRSGEGTLPASSLSARDGSTSTGANGTADSEEPDAAEGAILPRDPQEAARILNGTPAAGTPLDVLWGDAKLTFVYIPAGKFLMGSDEGEYRRDLDEPLHSVEITRGFWLARTECTQAIWYAVIGTEPSKFSGHPDLPVESVTWADLSGSGDSFMVRMNRDGALPAGWMYALPTEAQWEYACRAGTRTPFHFGNTFSSSLANGDGRVPYRGGDAGEFLSHPVRAGSYAPNAWGLYDMHGNIAECCLDAYVESPSGARDPLETNGGVRVLRGGSWADQPWHCRSAARRAVSENTRMDNTHGFRLAMVPVN